MGIAAALIVSGIIGIGTQIIKGGMDSMEQDKAREEEKSLADKLRRDTLTARNDQLALNKEQLALNKAGQAQNERQFLTSLAAQKEQAAINRGVDREKTSYERKKDNYANALALLNNDLALQDRLSKYWGGK